ncbi:tubulin-like doman-containing protein [Bacillus alkalicellulosilyticus]|uniref:tubulin-like doman-containing protein n=1 Tax=Alkalihalobacterium alkalicellulosilyticum TaxID=1912214 RepID=UPI000997A7DD|nr:tubulin-like doman-containing protein [Bacillus alkalicellulosilyticus]
MSHNVPTILIGLGGVGSSVVNTIYGRIPQDSRSNVAIHAFDTDVNTIKKMEHLVNNITQTSTRKSVGEYLHQNPSLLTWFPDNPQIRKKTMTEGAGQIRAVSRLAFRAAMGEGKMNSLWEGIDSIFPVSGDKMTYGVRVIIISSMVGGTGSGIFLQVAMYLREMLERKFGHSSVLIRGAFLLPDILVRTNTLDEREWESVRANGYSSLKELNAITMSASGQFKNEDDVTIDLEYRPNQIDLDGRTTHAITDKQLPFDFCFLYDYENLRGQHLNSVGQYIDQVSRTIYLQLFSPISAKHFSQEDNQILELISSEGRGRYCGAGAATLTYPYEDVVEYCSLKWAASGLDDSWLLLDRLYDEERNRYESDLRRGINRERPERGKRYIWQLETLVNDDTPQPFFNQVYRQVCEELDEGKLGEPKAYRFVDAVEARVQQILDGDAELKIFENKCRLDEGKLKIKNEVKREIGRVEASLEFYREQINKKVYEYRTFIAHQIVDQDCDSPSGSEGQGYRLNTWFMRKPTPLHPVAARFMLYQMSEEINHRIMKLRTENTNFKRQIDNYDEAFNIRETDTIETAMQRVDMALSRGFLGSIFSKDSYKEFIKDYARLSSIQLNTLNRFKKNLLLELVYTSVDQAIQSMIRDWERFFENLKDTRDNLLSELNQRAVQYENNNDQTKEYVLATKTYLESTWESIRSSVDQGMLPDSISEQIYLSHFRQYCKRNESTYTNYIEEMRVEELYRENVVAYCRNELKTRYQDRLDLTVIQALRREAAVNQVNPEEHIEMRISQLDYLSSPFIPSIENHRELKFWGVHSDSAKQLGEKLTHDIFDGKEVTDPAFSKYEVVCYRAHYGLSVENFSKFSSGDRSDMHQRQPGVYYEAYRRRIDRLNRGEATVTPHLDKRWHLPAFMPDLNPEQVQLDTVKNDRALLLGLMYGWIHLVQDTGRHVYLYNSHLSGSKFILKGGDLVTEETYQLHNAMSHNPVIYEEILERVQEETKKDKRNHSDIENHQFVVGAKRITTVTKDSTTNILDVALAYELEGLGDPSLPEKGARLRQCLLDEIVTYFSDIYGSHRIYQAKIDAAKFIEQLWEESNLRQVSDTKTAEFAMWKNLIDTKLRELKQPS